MRGYVESEDGDLPALSISRPHIIPISQTNSSLSRASQRLKNLEPSAPHDETAMSFMRRTNDLVSSDFAYNCSPTADMDIMSSMSGDQGERIMHVIEGDKDQPVNKKEKKNTNGRRGRSTVPRRGTNNGGARSRSPPPIRRRTNATPVENRILPTETIQPEERTFYSAAGCCVIPDYASFMAMLGFGNTVDEDKDEIPRAISDDELSHESNNDEKTDIEDYNRDCEMEFSGETPKPSVKTMNSREVIRGETRSMAGIAVGAQPSDISSKINVKSDDGLVQKESSEPKSEFQELVEDIASIISPIMGLADMPPPPTKSNPLKGPIQKQQGTYLNPPPNTIDIDKHSAIEKNLQHDTKEKPQQENRQSMNSNDEPSISIFAKSGGGNEKAKSLLAAMQSARQMHKKGSKKEESTESFSKTKNALFETESCSSQSTASSSSSSNLRGADKHRFLESQNPIVDNRTITITSQRPRDTQITKDPILPAPDAADDETVSSAQSEWSEAQQKTYLSLLGKTGKNIQETNTKKALGLIKSSQPRSQTQEDVGTISEGSLIVCKTKAVETSSINYQSHDIDAHISSPPTKLWNLNIKEKIHNSKLAGGKNPIRSSSLEKGMVATINAANLTLEAVTSFSLRTSKDKKESIVPKNIGKSTDPDKQTGSTHIILSEKVHEPGNNHIGNNFDDQSDCASESGSDSSSDSETDDDDDDDQDHKFSRRAADRFEATLEALPEADDETDVESDTDPNLIGNIPIDRVDQNHTKEGLEIISQHSSAKQISVHPVKRRTLFPKVKVKSQEGEIMSIFQPIDRHEEQVHQVSLDQCSSDCKNDIAFRQSKFSFFTSSEKYEKVKSDDCSAVSEEDMKEKPYEEIINSIIMADINNQGNPGIKKTFPKLLKKPFRRSKFQNLAKEEAKSVLIVEKIEHDDDITVTTANVSPIKEYKAVNDESESKFLEPVSAKADQFQNDDHESAVSKDDEELDQLLAQEFHHEIDVNPISTLSSATIDANCDSMSIVSEMTMQTNHRPDNRRQNELIKKKYLVIEEEPSTESGVLDTFLEVNKPTDGAEAGSIKTGFHSVATERASINEKFSHEVKGKGWVTTMKKATTHDKRNYTWDSKSGWVAVSKMSSPNSGNNSADEQSASAQEPLEQESFEDPFEDHLPNMNSVKTESGTNLEDECIEPEDRFDLQNEQHKRVEQSFLMRKVQRMLERKKTREPDEMTTLSEQGLSCAVQNMVGEISTPPPPSASPPLRIETAANTQTRSDTSQQSKVIKETSSTFTSDKLYREDDDEDKQSDLSAKHKAKAWMDLMNQKSAAVAKERTVKHLRLELNAARQNSDTQRTDRLETSMTSSNRAAKPLINEYDQVRIDFRSAAQKSILDISVSTADSSPDRLDTGFGLLDKYGKRRGILPDYYYAQKVNEGTPSEIGDKLFDRDWRDGMPVGRSEDDDSKSSVETEEKEEMASASNFMSQLQCNMNDLPMAHLAFLKGRNDDDRNGSEDKQKAENLIKFQDLSSAMCACGKDGPLRTIFEADESDSISINQDNNLKSQLHSKSGKEVDVQQTVSIDNMMKKRFGAPKSSDSVSTVSDISRDSLSDFMEEDGTVSERFNKKRAAMTAARRVDSIINSMPSMAEAKISLNEKASRIM